MSELAKLETEARNPATFDLDRLEPLALVEVLHRENYKVAEAVEPLLPHIAQLVEIVAQRLANGGRLFYVGAGTSGRLGVLDASECHPTFGVPPEMVQGIIAGGPKALTTPVEGAEDDREAGAAEIRARGVGPKDVVVGIAASGRTPFVLGALEAAQASGAVTAAVVNVREATMSRYAHFTLAAITGPEALAGSTRLKAGTAQKMILNLITTGAMVRMGKVYQNLMVDLRATNTKLRDRAIRIVVEAAGTDRKQAEQALEACDWECKTAIVMLRGHMDAATARARLQAAGGRVREALGE
jgi:N-acetylmuramic acid 6-phosphate etherase